MENELYSFFPTEKKLLFLKKIFQHPLKFFRLVRSVKSLETLHLSFAEPSKTIIAAYLNKAYLGFPPRKFGHAVLQVNDFESWKAGAKRRNLRKALRHCESAGLVSKQVSSEECLRTYVHIQKIRGAKIDLSSFGWTASVDEKDCLHVVVFDALNNAVALTSGVVQDNTSLIFVSVSTKTPEYSRWLSLHDFIYRALLRESHFVLSGIKIGVTLGNLEFQDRFGFEARNLKLI